MSSRTLHESVSPAPVTTSLAGGIPQVQHSTVGNTLGEAPVSLRGGVMPRCQGGQNEMIEPVQPEVIHPYTVQTYYQPGMVNQIGPPVLHPQITTQRPPGVNILQPQMSPAMRQMVISSPGMRMTHNMVPGSHQPMGGLRMTNPGKVQTNPQLINPYGINTTIQQPQPRMMSRMGHTTPSGMPRMQNMATSGQQHMGGMRTANPGIVQNTPRLMTPNYSPMNTAVQQPWIMGHMGYRNPEINTATGRPLGMPRTNMATSSQQHMGGMRIVNPGLAQNRPMRGVNMSDRQRQGQTGSSCSNTATPTLQMHQTVTSTTVGQSSALPSSSQTPQRGPGTSMMAQSSQGKINSYCNQVLLSVLLSSTSDHVHLHLELYLCILHRAQQHGFSLWCHQYNTRSSSESNLRSREDETDPAAVGPDSACSQVSEEREGPASHW